MARLGLIALAVVSAGGVARGGAAAPKEAARPRKLPFTVVSSMVGRRLPAFDVESGDDKRIDSKSLAGRVAVITYEARFVVEKNRAAKAALMSVLKTRYGPGEWELVAIVDTSSANFFTRRVWRRKLLENATKERITIYGDWDGKTAKALGVKRRESNLVIVDAAGTIRYFAYGVFDAREIERQKALLASLRPKRAPAGEAPAAPGPRT